MVPKTFKSGFTPDSADLLDLAASLSGIGYWHYETASQTLSWSDQVFAIHGISPGTLDLTLDAALAFLLPEDRKILASHFQLARMSGQGFAQRLRLTRADGALRHVACNAQCRLGADGGVTAIIGAFQDITEQHEAARRATEAESRFRLLADQTSDLVCLVGRDGALHYVSPASRHILGMPPEALRDTNLLNAIHPQDRAAAARLHLQLLSGARTEGQLDFRLQRAGREPLWVQASAHSLKNQATGEVQGYAGSLHDISERRTLTEALGLAEQKLRLAQDELAFLQPHLTAPINAADHARIAAHVLVVGDAAMNRDIAAAFLASAGHKVSTASSGAEALSLAAAEDFHVVLMDMHMPGMDGAETTRRLRALRGARGRVPVVAMMQVPTLADIETYRAAGMNTHLAKPFTCPQLLDSVSGAMMLRESSIYAQAPQLAPEPVQTPESEPVCDPHMFSQTASFLTQEALHAHVKTLAARSEEILAQLRAPAGITAKTLVDAAHSVAGSAGMFGFQRLSLSARRYEQILERDLPEQGPALQGFIAAIEVTLQHMQGRLAH